MPLRTNRHVVDMSTGDIAQSYIGESTMAKSANPAVPATSAVASAIETIGGRPLAEIQSTIVDIGFQTHKAERLMAEGKQALDVLDANLMDWVKALPYPEFMKVRDVHMTGSVDAGATVEAAQKIWERQVNRLISNHGFERPKSQSADAERKAQARAEAAAKLAGFGEGELIEKRDALLAKGDTKSISAAKVFATEIERRNADAISVEKANRKVIVSTITKRVKELARAETPDADAILAQVAAMLA